MVTDYKNWVPKGMVLSFFAIFGVFLLLFVVLGCSPLLKEGTVKTVLFWALLVFALVFCAVAFWTLWLYRVFSYEGKRQLSRRIVEAVARYVSIPDGGIALDVGCGSGALTIACAKRNPKASVVGIDRWGKEYASYNKALCDSNAKAEGVSNVSFRQGNAVKLDFADETFDAVTSNYVYHNVPVKDRQALLLETLRTLKKGGVFALHDIMTVQRYGDMEAFAASLRRSGYHDVRVINITGCIFKSDLEATLLDLGGSRLLVGRK